MEKQSPEKYEWKTIYTVVLVANAAYIILFIVISLCHEQENNNATTIHDN